MRPIRAHRSVVAALGAAALVVGGVMPAFAADADPIPDPVPTVQPTADPQSDPAPNPDPAPDTAPQSDPAPAPDPKPSWKQDAVGWWYDLGNGSFVHSEVREIGGSVYRFDANGYMVTGWYGVNGAREYYGTSGAQARSWVQVGSSWYYLDPETGIMRTGWQNVGGTWYFLDASGAMATGWVSQGGAWYYMDANGAMLTGWNVVRGSWYYFRSSGEMVTGWLNLGGTWYYLNGSGAMVMGTQWIGSERHWFYDSGAWWGLYPEPSRGGGSGNARTFNNCTEAWNAGAAPLRRGDPGYSADLDRDGDGVACEVRPR